MLHLTNRVKELQMRVEADAKHLERLRRAMLENITGFFVGDGFVVLIVSA